MNSLGFIRVSLLAYLVVSGLSAAHARSLAGTLSLDTAPLTFDLPIDITVNNHSFLVVPPAFTVIRPITSRETTRVVLKKGDAQVDYLIENIIEDPVDYTVQMVCVGCATVFRRQYFSPTGNKFGFANSVYIDPEDLPASQQLQLITDASIEGVIELQSGLAERELIFELLVSSDQNPAVIYQTLSDISMAAGENSVAYSVAGLRRSIAEAQFRVSLRCRNCVGPSGATLVFPEVLSPQQNHQSIDFLVLNPPSVTISPIIDLLIY